jgi:hypothetical protein
MAGLAMGDLGDPYSGRLRTCPNLKIFKPIVGTDAIFMMHGLRFCEEPPDASFDYQTMLHLIFSATYGQLHISLSGYESTAAPSGVARSRWLVLGFWGMMGEPYSPMGFST